MLSPAVGAAGGGGASAGEAGAAGGAVAGAGAAGTGAVAAACCWAWVRMGYIWVMKARRSCAMVFWAPLMD